MRQKRVSCALVGSRQTNSGEGQERSSPRRGRVGLRENQTLIPARLTSDSSRQAYVVERKYVLRLVESHRLSALVLIVAFHRANASGQLHQHTRSPSSSDAVDLFVMAWIVSTTAHSLESGQALLQPREVVWSQPTPATFHDTNASVRQEPA